MCGVCNGSERLKVHRTQGLDPRQLGGDIEALAGDAGGLWISGAGKLDAGGAAGA